MHTNKSNKIVHFIGIGGIGMSALARWFLNRNWAVSGSDIAESEITQELKKLGVKVKIGHKRGNISPKTSLVIYNKAISKTNPETQEARRRNLKLLTYSQMLGELTKEYTTIAIAGAHGKSTTTALVSLILIRAGFDPTVIIGTKLREFGNSNFRAGKSNYLIIEADEFGGSFWDYSPTHAIITNIDREHLDFYKNFANVKKSFLKFIANIKNGGSFIVNRDDRHLYVLQFPIEKLCKKNNVHVFWYSNKQQSFKIKKILNVPGAHNVSNAIAAYTLAKNLGISEKIIFEALHSYHGAWRRLEYKGTCHMSHVTCHIYDDYAHHPTEIKATLQALREKYPLHKIVCVFQPHQAERLRLLFKEFITAFDLTDYVILLPVYTVAGRDKINKNFTSQKLAEAISKKRKNNIVFYINNPSKIKSVISRILNLKSYILNPVVVMMGAGDIVNYTKRLIKTPNLLSLV